MPQVITRTIHYVKASDGSELVHPSSTSLTFTRTMNKDLVTNTITYSDWSGAQEFNSVISPTIVGYVPDQTITPALQVNLQNGVPTNDQLNVYVKYNDITGKVPDSDPQVWIMAQTPDPVFEPVGKVPDTDPEAWSMTQIPDPVFEPTGKVPDTDPEAWSMTQMPDPVFEPVGKVPDTDPEAWSMAQTPDPVFEPVGKVPDTDPQVWTIAQTPDPVFEPVGKVPDTDPEAWSMTQIPDPVLSPLVKFGF